MTSRRLSPLRGFQAFMRSGGVAVTIMVVASFALLAIGGSYALEWTLNRWFLRDLNVRAHLIQSALESPLERFGADGNSATLRRRLERITKDERLFAIALCNQNGREVASSSTFAPPLHCPQSPPRESTFDVESARGDSHSFHVSTLPLQVGEGHEPHSLVIIHDLSYAHERASTAQRALFGAFLLLGFCVSLGLLMIVRRTLRRTGEHLRTMIRDRRGEASTLPAELLPVLKEFRSLLREFESERRFREQAKEAWSAARLKSLLGSRLAGDQMFIVANREPYIHVRQGSAIHIQTPASGMVTALEPIMRACSGTWVAHGSGSADKEVVDANSRVWVPPGKREYQIKRIWLSEEEENGYYYGFANEGLWPLCHIAHIRPVFRKSDWEHYVHVNERFADAVVEEATRDDPIVLVQDYHFALLPRMIRERLPKATIITFWHIPWPNAEKFAICPWQREILRGLLGSTIIGFHTRFHVNNFLDTIDMALESRVDRENFTVTHQGELSAVRHYPISIEFPPHFIKETPPIQLCREEILNRHRLAPNCILGVGVERLDYTKGLIERFRAIERFLEKHPEMVGKFHFIQIAAPSRSKIESYASFAREVRDLADKINSRFSGTDLPPIDLREEHRDAPDICKYYRAANFCMVTSLHDGMNLVAKEFIAARDDCRGALILSIFAGASRELPEALQINPYDTEQCAEAIHQAIAMTELEQAQRMTSMREQVREWNVYRWAARMIIDAAELRERSRILKQVSIQAEANSLEKDFDSPAHRDLF